MSGPERRCASCGADMPSSPGGATHCFRCEYFWDEPPRRRVLIGAGGNAKTMIERVDAYVDPVERAWVGKPRIRLTDLLPGDEPVLGVGGVKPSELRSRLAIWDEVAALVTAPGDGVIVKAGAVVEPGVAFGRAVLVNSGAIVCHDAAIGHGSHVAPGAVVLGGAKVGECCMIGAGAVVLPGADVPDDTLVKAQTRWPR